MSTSNYEDIVIEYLRADRALFVNTECCIELYASPNPDTSGPHWYCDAVVADFRNAAVFLCEVTFANPPQSLHKRLADWTANWPGVCAALARDSHLPGDWPVRPWLFVPEEQVEWIVQRVRKLQRDAGSGEQLPEPRITPLELVQPWKYKSWNREGEQAKSPAVPESMRV